MATLRNIEFDSHRAIDIRERGERMIIVHDVGPRIAWFGRGRTNLLFWDSLRAHERGPWRLLGGHRLWVTRPDADESEETYARDDRPCRLRRVPDGIVVTAPPDGSRIEKSITVRRRAGTWIVEHRLRNTGDMLWCGGAWALTCTRPGPRARYRVPIDGGPPAWDLVTIVTPRSWGGGHTSRLDDRQIALERNAVVARPRGIEAKRMLWSPTGTLEMIDPAIGAFRKTSRPVDQGAYPLATNVAFYLAPKAEMVELETMSPQQRLLPGEALSHVEIWSLGAAIAPRHRSGEVNARRRARSG